MQALPDVAKPATSVSLPDASGAAHHVAVAGPPTAWEARLYSKSEELAHAAPPGHPLPPAPAAPRHVSLLALLSGQVAAVLPSLQADEVRDVLALFEQEFITRELRARDAGVNSARRDYLACAQSMAFSRQRLEDVAVWAQMRRSWTASKPDARALASGEKAPGYVKASPTAAERDAALADEGSDIYARPFRIAEGRGGGAQ